MKQQFGKELDAALGQGPAPKRRAGPSVRIRRDLYIPHMHTVTVVTRSGISYDASWAGDPPSEEEALAAWEEDTRRGHQTSPNWRRY